MSWRVRLAEDRDMEAFADIVNHYIRHGAIHFGEHEESADDWRAEWQPIRSRYPWLVAERDGQIDGVALSKPWNTRSAYGWTAEATIYLRDGLAGQRIGRTLYGRLLELLDAQGYRMISVGITLPNDPSIALHESFGFTYVGTMERSGFKEGRWHDVGLWQRLRGTADQAPGRVRSLEEVI
jgi:L-amino acid N-acyltransferase YncA